MTNPPPRSFAVRIPRAALALALATCGTLIAPADLRAENELIPNDKFADDGASWKLFTERGVTAQMSVEKVDNEPALCIDVTSNEDGSAVDPEKVVNVRVYRLFGEISSDALYHISFKAKAQKDTGIVSFISPEREGARVLWRMDVKLDTEWKEFTYNFTARDSASDAAFGFARLGGVTNKYWFKDVVLTAD